MIYRLFFATEDDAGRSIRKLKEDGWTPKQLDLPSMSVWAVIPGGLQKIFQNKMLPWSSFQELINTEYRAIDYVQVAYAQAAEIVV